MFHTSEFWPRFSETNIRQFLESTGDQPTPSQALNEEGIRASKHKIKAFLRHIQPLDSTTFPCKDEYVAFEQERLVLLNVVLGANQAEQLADYNDELYGSLADMHYHEVLQYLKHYLQNLDPRSAPVSAARDLLLETWHTMGSDNMLVSGIFAQADAYRLKLRPLVAYRFGFLETLLETHQPNEILTPQAAQSILQSSLKPTLGEAGTSWTTIIQDGAPNVFIDYEHHAIVIPAGRNYTLAQIRVLVVHEIGVHVTRSVRGETSHERLAGYGLHGYGPTEEAFAELLGTAGTSHRPNLGPLEAFAIIDFATPATGRSFREVYDLVKALILCLANPDDTQLDQHRYNYQRKAFARTIRMLRLGTNVLVDRSMTKYWRGGLLLNHYFQSHEVNEQTVGEFLLGKYEPTNLAQLELIKHHTRG